ncbi:MAG: DUF3858 domain-containing protein [Bacteroidales bacterium]|nr:DUF3858 domain-containing protein [Parabacteroides sp.]MDY5621944.1 DUF3858 domain-containing protein [Bacteroidales bacterium]
MTNLINKIICLLIVLGTAISVSAAPEAEFKKLIKSWTLNTDGSQEFHYNMELTIYSYLAMRSLYGESFIQYNPEYQTLKINSSFTKQKDGTIVKTPDNAFVEVLPRSAADAPAYNHLKEMVVVHTGLELGATIYLDYTITTKAGYLPGLDIFEPIQQASPIKEYSLSVTVPVDKDLSYSLANPQVMAKVNVEEGMRTISWKLKNVKPASLAPMQRIESGDMQYLACSTFENNKEALNYLFGQFDRPESMPLISLAETLTEGKNTDTEKLQAIHSFIVNDFAHSRLSLSETGYHIRPAEDVIRSAYGTDAELINLLYGLLSAAKIETKVCAAYPVKDPQECSILKAVRLFIQAKADGQTYLLTSGSSKMSEIGWTADYCDIRDLKTGEEVDLTPCSPNLSYDVTMKLSDKEVVSNIKANIPSAFVAYSDSKATAFSAGDKNASVSQKENVITVNYQTTGKVESVPGYYLLRLPDSPAGVAHQPYASFNSTRDCNLFLPYAPNETYTYTIEVPANMELSTPTAEKNISNAAGNCILSIKQTGNKVEVSRSLKINSNLIKRADYTAFHALMAAWATINDTPILFKQK